MQKIFLQAVSSYIQTNYRNEKNITFVMYLQTSTVVCKVLTNKKSTIMKKKMLKYKGNYSTPVLKATT